MSDLVVAPCSHEAAKFAVMNWHYSGTMPKSKLVKFGVWEDEHFIGAMIFGHGASPHLGKSLGLDITEVCELIRVALTDHQTPVSRIIAKGIRLLDRAQPRLRCVVSFADPKEGHRGGIYQAGNWIYTGQSNDVTEYLIDGRWRHTRAVYSRPERKTAPTRQMPGKYRYLYPLDRAMRRKIQPLALPYPRGSGLKGETPTVPVGGSGSIPESRSNTR